jgi:hypothetical protein
VWFFFCSLGSSTHSFSKTPRTYRYLSLYLRTFGVTRREDIVQRCRNKRLRDLVWASRSLCLEDLAMRHSRMVFRYTTTLSSVRSCFTLVVQGSNTHTTLTGTGAIAQAGSWILLAIVWGAVFSNPVILFSAHPVRLVDPYTKAMLTHLSCSCSTRQQSCSSPRVSLSYSPRTHQSKRSTAHGLTPDSTTLPSRALSPASS